jgi:hypothetical protein
MTSHWRRAGQDEGRFRGLASKEQKTGRAILAKLSGKTACSLSGIAIGQV